MRVFRPTRTTKSGQKKPYAKWYVEFRDHLESIRRLPAFTDKKQSEELGRKIERLVACRSNGESPDTALGRWLESMPPKLRDRLAAIGLLSGESVAAGKFLAAHLDDFQAALAAKGDTEKHARLVANRARRLVKKCRFQFWNNLSASKVQACLAELRDGGNGLSIQTSNFYLQAIKQFCKWMVRDGRANRSPLEHLQGQNVQTDRRHDRRALAVEETRWLLRTTLAGPEQAGVCGAERYLIYRLALESGLRAKEIRTLSRSSFDFTARPATVTVEAAYSKRRRLDVLPLRPDTADLLREHLAKKLPEAAAFATPQKDRLAGVVRADLAAARAEWIDTAPTLEERNRRESSSFLVYRDESGRVADFHALRHTFITNLASSGSHPKVAQLLARHSTITLTMDRYTHSLWEDLSEALGRLPDLSGPTEQPQRATGTDGRRNVAESMAQSVAFCVALKDPESSTLVQSGAVNAQTATGQPGNGKPREFAENSGKTGEENGGSAWESNPPATRITRRPTVLKTAATTRCASTSDLLTSALEGSLGAPAYSSLPKLVRVPPA